MKTLANTVGYQLVWLLAVWGAGHGHPWLGPLALLPLAIAYLVRRDGWRDAALLIAVGAFGTVIDSLFAASHLLAFASPVPSPMLAPVWIVAIWMAFALTLRHTWRFAFRRLPLAAAIGAIGAPLAYLAAARGWHALQFPSGPFVACVVLGTVWALAMPAMLALARRVDSAPRGPNWSDAHA
jgi:Protein of unknown function (DUF2878)